MDSSPAWTTKMLSKKTKQSIYITVLVKLVIVQNFWCQRYFRFQDICIYIKRCLKDRMQATPNSFMFHKFIQYISWRCVGLFLRHGLTIQARLALDLWSSWFSILSTGLQVYLPPYPACVFNESIIWQHCHECMVYNFSTYDTVSTPKSYQKILIEPGMVVAHTYKPSTGEEEAGRSL